MMTQQKQHSTGIRWRRKRRLALAIATAVLAVSAAGTLVALAETIRTGPSAFPHVVDGQFTDTNPSAPGIEEWSDITAVQFFVPTFGDFATVYTDQGSGAVQLMYDVAGRAPLLPTEHFDVQFNVLEGGVLENYLIKCFGVGHVGPNPEVFVDGNGPVDPEGITCAASPPTADHLRVELSVPLNTVYSPDTPLFWSANVEGGQRPGSGGEKPPGDPVVSATITFAGSDGKTTVLALDPDGEDLADLCTDVGELIEVLVPPPPPKGTGVYKNKGDYVNKVAKNTEIAVASLVSSGVITPEEGVILQGCVVSARAKKK